MTCPTETVPAPAARAGFAAIAGQRIGPPLTPRNFCRLSVSSTTRRSSPFAADGFSAGELMSLSILLSVKETGVELGGLLSIAAEP